MTTDTGAFRYTCVKCGIGTDSAYVLDGIAYCFLCVPQELRLVPVAQPGPGVHGRRLEVTTEEEQTCRQSG